MWSEAFKTFSASGLGKCILVIVCCIFGGGGRKREREIYVMLCYHRVCYMHIHMNEICVIMNVTIYGQVTVSVHISI